MVVMMNGKKTSPKFLEFDDADEDILQEMWDIKIPKSKNCNSDGEDSLETILEVPIPEEMYEGCDITNDGATCSWHDLRYFSDKSIMSDYLRNADKSCESLLDREFFALMKLVGSPFVPTTTTAATISQPKTQHILPWNIANSSLEVAKAKYILQQYIATSGRKEALNSVKNMNVVGQTKMLGPEETHQADNNVHMEGKHKAGGFVLSQRNTNLWHLEMVVHGLEFNAGSDGNVSWDQTSWRPNCANKGPPRLLRRFVQGLDPKSIASLFSNAVYVGEKIVKHQDCFILKLQIAPTTLKEQSSPNTDISNYSVWGYFSQKTGLLIQLTDIMHLKTNLGEQSDDAFWKIHIESQMEDYRNIEGINIAHAGRTYARLDKFGESDNARWKLEELWKIEQVHFNVHGLSMENFLPPTTTYPIVC